MTEGQERRLIRRLQQRDEAAFEEVVVLYRHKVFNLIFRMTGSRAEADDLAQDVFVTVLKSIDQFRGESKFSTWLYRVAVNHCKNRIKYLARRAHKSTGDLDEQAERDLQQAQPSSLAAPHFAAPDAALEGRQLEKILQDGIAQLDEEHRALIILRDMENLSYEEISAITGLPDGTVKSRLHRGRMALKEYIDRHYKAE